MNLTKRDAAAVALMAVSLASAGAAVTVPARAASAVEQAVAARDAAVIERDQAVQAAENDYGHAQAVAAAEHDRAVAAARGDREGEYQAAVLDRDAAVADLGKIKDPSRESVRERGDKYAQKCEDVSRTNPIKNAPKSPLGGPIIRSEFFWESAGVDMADEGRCREAGDKRIAADLAEAKADVAERRKAIAAVRDENAQKIAQIDKAAGPAIEQAGQARGQAVAQAQAQRDATVQAAHDKAAPVIASADADIDAGQGSQTGTMILWWLSAVAALAGAVWLGRGRLAQLPVRKAGGALTTVAVWLVQGWAKAAMWAVQQRRGSRFKRDFEDSAHSGLQAGAFSSAEVLKGNEMAHRWDASKPQRAVSRTRVALTWLALSFLAMSAAQWLGKDVPDTLAETSTHGFVYFLSHLAPVSWMLTFVVVAALAVAGIGHALPLDAPMPPPAAPGSAPAADPGPDAPGDVVARSLSPADQKRWAHLLAPATVLPIRGGHQHTWVLPAGLPASAVNHERLMSNAHALGGRPRIVERSGQRVVVDVLDTDELPPVQWTAARRTNFRDDVPVGESATGRPVGIGLAGARVAIIAPSGHGKTFAARTLVLWAAQDPAVDLRVADLKGDATLAMLRDRADQWETGEDLDAARAMIRGVADEVRRRNLWAGKDPEGRHPIDVFGPLVLFVDEVDVVAKAEEDALVTIARRGRSAGVTIILATQETSQKSFPTVALQNCTTRFVGRFGISDYPRQMMGVPDGMDTSGLGLGEWAVKTEDRSDWRMVTFALVDDREARERASEAARVHAETLPVVAQDTLPEPAEPEPDPLVDLLATMGDRSGMTWAEVADELGEDAAAACREVLPSQTLRRPDGYPRGVRREAVEAAVQGRHMAAT